MITSLLLLATLFLIQARMTLAFSCPPGWNSFVEGLACLKSPYLELDYRNTRSFGLWLEINLQSWTLMLNLCRAARWRFCELNLHLHIQRQLLYLLTIIWNRLDPWYIPLCELFIFLCNLLDATSEWFLWLIIAVRINSVLTHDTEYFTVIFIRAASGRKWETEKEVSYQALGEMFWGWYSYTAAFADHNYWNRTGATPSSFKPPQNCARRSTVLDTYVQIGRQLAKYLKLK